MANPVVVARAAALLSDEKTRKGLGWVVAAVLSPLILIVAALCVLGSGAASHNISAVQMCFEDGPLPDDLPEEYRVCVEETRAHFAEIDTAVTALQSNMEDGSSLDPTRVKAVFYTLYFGGKAPDIDKFLDCFVTYEERTRTVPVEGSDPPTEVEQTYTVPVPVADINKVYEAITANLGTTIPDDLPANVDSVYSLDKNGYPGLPEGSDFEGADVPFVGADGFCSPVGANWRSIVTSEFGGRLDPITGKRDGHTGMDLAVPTGTPVRAALGGTVTTATYHSSYGYYVMVDHGNGLSTLYAHNSRLMVKVGQTVETGDVVSLSGSTGRSTGPHLHFEVRVNGQRTNPRNYLP